MRIPLTAGRLMIGLGLAIGLATATNGLVAAQREVLPGNEPSVRQDLVDIGLVQAETAALIGIPDRIVVPAIQLDAPVTTATLQEIQYQRQPFQQWVAPNFFAAGLTTSAPLGSDGNTVLIGHHNEYGEVFAHLIDLQIGDVIRLYSGEKEFDYVITQKMLLRERYEPVAVRLDNAKWIADSGDETLTLVTCWPKESNSHRLVIVAKPIDVDTYEDYAMIPRITPTAPPTTATPEGLNPDHAQFVADVTIPDGTQLAPGALFTKTWRIKNVGDTTWTGQYSLETVGGSPMALTRQVFFLKDVAPGQSVDLSVELVAPESPGDHTSLFQFRNAEGVPFGVGRLFNEVVYVRITVVVNPLPTGSEEPPDIETQE
jgi:LPXTG-site transpeptidase (sortase) family protein